jgi:hypothetical protein
MDMATMLAFPKSWRVIPDAVLISLPPVGQSKIRTNFERFLTTLGTINIEVESSYLNIWLVCRDNWITAFRHNCCGQNGDFVIMVFVLT